MAYNASHRFARIAPRKARLVADMIRGKSVDEALVALDFEKKRGAAFITVVLKSAIANAEEKNADPTKLFVSESRIDEGPTLDRFQPGLGNPVVKVEVREGQPSAPAAPSVDLEVSSFVGAVPGPGAENAAELQSTLARISARLDELERRLG